MLLYASRTYVRRHKHYCVLSVVCNCTNLKQKHTFCDWRFSNRNPYLLQDSVSVSQQPTVIEKLFRGVVIYLCICVFPQTNLFPLVSFPPNFRRRTVGRTGPGRGGGIIQTHVAADGPSRGGEEGRGTGSRPSLTRLSRNRRRLNRRRRWKDHAVHEFRGERLMRESRIEVQLVLAPEMKIHIY